jgi:hypothetical protein
LEIANIHYIHYYERFESPGLALTGVGAATLSQYTSYFSVYRGTGSG